MTNQDNAHSLASESLRKIDEKAIAILVENRQNHQTVMEKLCKSSMPFAKSYFSEVLSNMASEANRECGLSYELYSSRIIARIDRYVETLKQPVAECFIVLAREKFGYRIIDEEMQDAPKYEIYACSHGLDPDCCPAGCGDIEV